jgi:hypothetical protein
MGTAGDAADRGGPHAVGLTKQYTQEYFRLMKVNRLQISLHGLNWRLAEL